MATIAVMRVLVMGAVMGMAVCSVNTSHAQVRPTSDDISLISGRTVGNGEVVLAAALGWPGFWAELLLAPTSRFNIGFRAGVTYGSPLLGLETGIGGEFSIPIRILLYGQNDIDIALSLRPLGVVGEGALVGQQAIFRDNLGWAVGAEVGTRAGFHVTDAVTLAAGVSVTAAYVDTPDAADSNGIVIGFAGILGLEAVMSRKTMLFVELRGGYGIAPDGLFESEGLLSLALGVAFRLS